MLCMTMGSVNRSKKWKDSTKGLPQGAVLSPLCANIYLHEFDEFILSLSQHYIRYADDFVILCAERGIAEELADIASEFLKNNLFLSLNTPIIKPLEEGFEFLKIHICKSGCRISEKKRGSILHEISSIIINEKGLNEKDKEKWIGYHNYYGCLIPEEEKEGIEFMSHAFKSKAKGLIKALCDLWISTRKQDPVIRTLETKKVVRQKKLEYQKKKMKILK